jgi:protein-S-isoprenylcysteine O-methyltransferase Ste14
MNLLSIALRVYLLAGLIAHKVVWEIMKRRPGRPSKEQQVAQPVSGFAQILKAAKLAVMLGLFVQILLPQTLFPIMGDPLVLCTVGALLFTFGLLTAIVARIQLGRNWSDIEVGQVKRDHALVNYGLYRYVRHPIYTGDLVMLIGFELSLNSWLVLAILCIAMPTIFQTIREEKRLLETVNGYDAYCAQTKRFIPFVI